MSVQIVFDTSAVVTYARGSVAAGELIAMVTEDNGRIGVPITCLAEAYTAAKGTEADLLALLSNALPAVVVLALELPDTPAVGALARNSSIGVGHAVTAAARTNAYLATSDRAQLHRLAIGDDLIIDLEG